MKAAKFAGGGLPRGFDIRDQRGARPASQLGKQCLQDVSLALGDDFNAAIPAVAHPADQAQEKRFFLDEIAKAHALNAALDTRMQTYDIPICGT